PISKYDPNGLSVAGYMVSPSVKSENGKSIYHGVYGYYSDLFSFGNPYEPGSCEHTRRQDAMALVENLVNQAAASPTVRDVVKQQALNQVRKDPDYYGGRALANTGTALLFKKGMGRVGAGGVAATGMQASAATLGMSLASYSALIDLMEKTLPECECQ
ncbi:hypothetical protein, partial [Marinibactrum halimedae]